MTDFAGLLWLLSHQQHSNPLKSYLVLEFWWELSQPNHKSSLTSKNIFNTKVLGEYY
jgi:hypothetical protein